MAGDTARADTRPATRPMTQVSMFIGDGPCDCQVPGMARLVSSAIAWRKLRDGLRAQHLGPVDEVAFAQLHQEARDSIVQRLTFLRESGQPRADRIIAELKRTLKEEGVEATVSGREKTPYSIWRKMQRKNVPFEQLSDIMAFRIVVDNVPDCYRALGVFHSAYSMVPGRFKDFISTPKPNGYQSLHTGVIGPEKQRIEIQIRTPEMHEVADFGVAAHWRYKQGGGAGPVDGRQYRWLRELLDILEHAAGPEEFLEHTKLEMFQDQVFCFTPKGDLIALPRGATPVDFAYAVHSEVGNTCVGAKINGRHMPLRTQLHNGDQVEVVTSRAQTPSPTWERFVVTGKARACIRRFIRTQQRAQYVDLGRAILQKAFKQDGYDFTEKALEGVLKKFHCESVDDLFAAVGEGLQTEREVMNAVFPGSQTGKSRADQGGAARRAGARAATRPRTTPSPSPASSRAWPCISPAAATRCRATASSASSPPARASPSTPSTARRSRASPTRPSAGSTCPGTWAPRATACMWDGCMSCSPTGPAISAACRR